METQHNKPTAQPQQQPQPQPHTYSSSEAIKTEDWITRELEDGRQNTDGEYEKLPGLKFEENKITEVRIDFSKPFQKWKQTDDNGKTVIKAIIPVLHDQVRKNWWLNCANPVYRKILDAAKKGRINFKVLRTGQTKDTKYVLVE